MAASKPELRSRGKGKTETKDVKTPDAKKKTAEPAGPMDAQGNVMNADYYFKQYVGLVLSMIAFGCVCFAGYAPKYGYTVNLFLYSSTSHPLAPCPFSLLGASHRDALRSPSIPNSKESFRRLPSYTFLTRPPVHSLSFFTGVVFGCVGLVFHESRPFKNAATFAMDKATVEFSRAQEAEAKIRAGDADRAAKKKA